jgi:hypothetical protein
MPRRCWRWSLGCRNGENGRDTTCEGFDDGRDWLSRHVGRVHEGDGDGVVGAGGWMAAALPDRRRCGRSGNVGRCQCFQLDGSGEFLSARDIFLTFDIYRAPWSTVYGIACTRRTVIRQSSFEVRADVGGGICSLHELRGFSVDLRHEIRDARGPQSILASAHFGGWVTAETEGLMRYLERIMRTLRSSLSLGG